MASVYGVEEFRSTRKLPKTTLSLLEDPLEMTELVGLLAPVMRKLWLWLWLLRPIRSSPESGSWWEPRGLLS